MLCSRLAWLLHWIGLGLHVIFHGLFSHIHSLLVSSISFFCRCARLTWTLSAFIFPAHAQYFLHLFTLQHHTSELWQFSCWVFLGLSVPGKGMYTTISKGSSQGLIQLSLTWQALQAGFLQNGHGFSSSHISGFFFLFFSGFLCFFLVSWV